MQGMITAGVGRNTGGWGSASYHTNAAVRMRMEKRFSDRTLVGHWCRNDVQK